MTASGPGLFDDLPPAPERVEIGAQACLLRGFAGGRDTAFRRAIDAVVGQADFRNMQTPGGGRMSAAMTSCGGYGWVTDRRGYRYAAADPESGAPWPAMPRLFATLAAKAARRAGFEAFEPDACLVNRYAVGARMGLHQDKDEADYDHPIVSVSLGLPAVFLWGGPRRADKPERLLLEHGDVLVWGGVDRLRYHGIAPVKAGFHPFAGEQRINLTLRRAH